MQFKNNFFVVFLRVPKYMKDSIGWTNGIRFVKTDHSKDFRIIFFRLCFSIGKEFGTFSQVAQPSRKSYPPE